MAPSLFKRIALLALSTVSLAQSDDAASASNTVGGDLAFAVNVPSNSSSDMFVNFRLPARRISWGAFGFGESMDNALMFVVYADEGGNGITVSPRLSTGHVMPQHTSNIGFTVLPESGIINGSFIVKGMCTNCRSWEGGSVDVSSDEQPMIWASGPASTLESNDLDARISVHQSKGRFAIDMRTAEGAPGIPSFALSDTSRTGDNIGPPVGGGPSNGLLSKPLAVIAHAIIMIFAFLILFPGGYAVLRLMDKVLIHAGIQSLAALLVIVATALGIVASKKTASPDLNAPHQIIGLVTLALVLLALILGATGHAIYRRTNQPWKFMISHRIFGPASIGLGLGNCVVGFRFAGHYRPTIGFVVAAMLIWAGITVAVLMRRRREVRKNVQNTPAAMNFREGQAAGGQWYGGAQGQPPPGHGPAIPLESYQREAPPVYK